MRLDDDVEYRTLSRKGKCCICGRPIIANKDKVIHCYNYKSNAGTITICNYCIDHIYNKAHEDDTNEKSNSGR